MKNVLYENKCVLINFLNGKHIYFLDNDSTHFMENEGSFIENANIHIQDSTLTIEGTEVRKYKTWGDDWLIPHGTTFLLHGQPIEDNFDLRDIDIESITEFRYRHWWHIFFGKKTRRFIPYYFLRKKRTNPFRSICTNWQIVTEYDR